MCQNRSVDAFLGICLIFLVHWSMVSYFSLLELVWIVEVFAHISYCTSSYTLVSVLQCPDSIMNTYNVFSHRVYPSGFLSPPNIFHYFPRVTTQRVLKLSVPFCDIKYFYTTENLLKMVGEKTTWSSKNFNCFYVLIYILHF